MPSEPGVCIEGGFIADASGQYQKIFAIGFRFPSLPDVSFSISSNKDQQRDAPFSTRRSEAKKFAEETGQGEAFARVKVVREGKRQLAQWQIEEALFARPRKDGGTNHEFVLESPGIRYNKDQPFWDAVLAYRSKTKHSDSEPQQSEQCRSIGAMGQITGHDAFAGGTINFRECTGANLRGEKWKVIALYTCKEFYNPPAVAPCA